LSNVLNLINIQIEVLWVATLYSVAVGYQRFGGLVASIFRVKMEAERSYHNTTRRHNAEDLHLNLHCRENVRSLTNVIKCSNV
jgi:hypothetical protein